MIHGMVIFITVIYKSHYPHILLSVYDLCIVFIVNNMNQYLQYLYQLPIITCIFHVQVRKFRRNLTSS